MSHILGMVKSFRSRGFALETSVSVFGDQQDIMLFSYRLPAASTDEP